MPAPPMVVLDQDDTTRDLLADESGLVLAVGARAVGVLVMNNIAQQPGDDRMQPERGTNWGDLLGKGATPVGIQTAIARRAASVDGVTRVASCSVTAPGKGSSTAIAELSVETAEGGPVSLSIALGGG